MKERGAVTGAGIENINSSRGRDKDKDKGHWQEEQEQEQEHTVRGGLKHGFLSKNKNFLYTQAFSTVVWYVKSEYIFFHIMLSDQGVKNCNFAL